MFKELYQELCLPSNVSTTLPSVVQPKPRNSPSTIPQIKGKITWLSEIFQTNSAPLPPGRPRKNRRLSPMAVSPPIGIGTLPRKTSRHSPVAASPPITVPRKISWHSPVAASPPIASSTLQDLAELPTGQLRRSSRNSPVVASPSIGSRTLRDVVDFNTVPPISDDPGHVMEEISRICLSLLDISLRGYTIFKRSLEYFAQLSEKMLQFIQTQNTGLSISTKNAIGRLREKIKDFRNLLTQVNCNPSLDYNSQTEIFVNDIYKTCRGLYDKLYLNK